MQTFGSCCTGIGVLAVAVTFIFPEETKGLGDALVLGGSMLIIPGLIMSVLGRKPNQPV